MSRNIHRRCESVCVCVCVVHHQSSFPSCLNRRPQPIKALGRPAEVWCRQPRGSRANPAQSAPFMGPDSRCRSYWLVPPLRCPSVFMSSYWPTPWTAPTASNYDDKAGKDPRGEHVWCIWDTLIVNITSTGYVQAVKWKFLCVSVFVSPTWPSSKMASRSLWRHWRTTCCPVCPRLQETSWVTQSWWKTWRRPNARPPRSK